MTAQGPGPANCALQWPGAGQAGDPAFVAGNRLRTPINIRVVNAPLLMHRPRGQDPARGEPAGTGKKE